MVPRSRAVLRSILCLVVLLAGAMFVGSASADDGAWKAENDSDPHVPLAPYQEQMLVQKQRAVAANFATSSGHPVAVDTDAPRNAAIFDVDFTTLATLASSASLLANQTPQEKANWCGPAAVVEALGQMGISITQTTAALKLGTDASGTAWSGGSTSTRHPVPDVLNLYQSRNYYVPWAVPGSPSAGDISNYKSYLLNNINYPRAPLIGDAWETPSSAYHLSGHPSTREIFHWFDIRGYAGSGADTMYEDSVHDATSVSWYVGVPAYSTMASNKIVTIVGGRGYVW